MAPGRLRLPGGIEGWTYWALGAAFAAPLWMVSSLPTTDGASHVYNAWVLLRLLTGTAPPLVRAAFAVDPRPLPNWLTHGALALLLTVCGPRTAEKILVTAYVALFLYAVRRLAGAVAPERRSLAFLAFPFLYNWPVQMGFYNFGLGMALAFLSIAAWWRGREAVYDGRGLAGYALRVNALLLLAYFAHAVPHAVALVAIGMLWLAGLPCRRLSRHLLHLALLAPQAVLPLWFASGAGRPLPRRSGGGELALYLVELRGLVAFGPRQEWLAAAVAWTFLAILVLALALALAHRRRSGRWRWGRPREEDGFLLAALALVALCFLAPEGASQSGAFLPWRLTLFPWFLALPWISLEGSQERPGKLLRGAALAATTALAGLAVADLAIVVPAYRALDALRAPYFRALAAAPPGGRLLPLVFDPRSLDTPLSVFLHASGYQAAEKGMVDWSDYEAATTYFPVRFRPGVERPDIWRVEVSPWDLQLGAWSGTVDDVLTWKQVPSPSIRRLARHYDLVAEDGPARLYRVRR